jgi:hypothetical protein
VGVLVTVARMFGELGGTLVVVIHAVRPMTLPALCRSSDVGLARLIAQFVGEDGRTVRAPVVVKR